MLEPERYELQEVPAHHFQVDRRDFFKVFGAGIVLFLIDSRADAQESGGARRGGRMGGGEPQEISAWLHIGENGTVTAYTGKVEVGQNARTSLTQAVVEELRCDVDSVHFIMGDTDLTPFDMGTFGSRTTPTMWPQIRKASAALREMLLGMAADQWQVSPSTLTVAGGKVKEVNGSRSIAFAQLTKGQKIAKTIDSSVPLRPASEWKTAGHSIQKVNVRDMVSGKHQYTADLMRPGMLYGHVVRPSAFGAKLTSVDTSAAEKIPGVTVVHDGNFIAVAAARSQAAKEAASLIKAQWTAETQPSSGELFEYLKQHAEAGRTSAPIDKALSSADVKLTSTYNVAYIAHAPLEPRAAVAEWNEDKLTVWTGTQRPFGVRTELAEAFGIPEQRVRVLVPDTGSGYGGKHTGEAAIEAARLAKAAGKPVKVVWTREEEFTWAYFRPAGVIDVKSGASKEGKLSAWEFHNYNSGNSAIETLYDVPNKRIEFHPAKSPLRQGSYRGLAATANHFARESHMDEVAQAVGLDPLEFRLRNIKDERLRAVLQAAAEKFGWGKAKPAENHGFGLACGFDKGGYVGTCVEVAVRPKGTLDIVRVAQAFECGAVVNPEQLKNQVEGAVMMAVGGALFEAVDFENGRILNPRFSKYRVPRISDMPVLETVIIDRKDLPSAGAGECPIVGLAPAVANAIFAATGQRLRSMPLAPKGLKLA